MTGYKYKFQAYREIGSILIEYRNYFLSFVRGNNEYKECVDYKEFAPLEINTKLRKEYNDRILYFSDTMKKEIESVLASGEWLNGLAIVGIDNGDLLENGLEDACQEVVKSVDNCIRSIQQELK